MPDDPFRLHPLPGPPLRRAAFAAARPLLARLLKLNTFRALYAAVDHGAPESFAARALELLDIEVECAAPDLSRVPATGPLIVAANHPHGALDGLALAALLSRVRGDVRVLVNHLLARIPELRATCFFVDPFGGPAAAARSRAGLRAAHLWLRGGGTLVIFPAGEVAFERCAEVTPLDRRWHATLGRLAMQSGARVMPAFIEGSNSDLFYAAGRLHPAGRTALLARELLKKRGQRVRVHLGDPIAPADNVDATTVQVRQAADALGRDPASAIEAELALLPPESRLFTSGGTTVFCVRASDIPATLREIGRLRAVAFAAAGEGSGAAVDLDRFDEHYLHLFSWDAERRQIVGAYRIGCTDAIVAARGVDGLYTRTLFRYDRQFIDRLSPALELGRSFVRPEYQRSHSALLLLWRGIGVFLARHPHYRVLFGPVSISARYSDSSQALLKVFLEQNHRDDALAELVTAMNPLHTPRPAGVIPRTAEGANELIAALEADRKGMPVLLRQYLKLNARLIGFNVDPEFGDALDALMMVDLTAVDPVILDRYLGRRDALRYRSRHLTPDSSQAA